MISEDLNDVVYEYSNYEYGSQTITVYTAGVATVNYINTGCHVHGYFPFGYFPIQFGKLANLGDYFPASSYGSVRLEATGAVASGAGEVCLVQDQMY